MKNFQFSRETTFTYGTLMGFIASGLLIKEKSATCDSHQKKATTDQPFITNPKLNFKILILFSEIKYSLTSTIDRGVRIEN